MHEKQESFALWAVESRTDFVMLWGKCAMEVEERGEPPSKEKKKKMT